MSRLKCIIAYDGTQFSGYQIQPNKRTVQAELEHRLEQLHKGKEVKVTASGRTDAGVHAKGQVIHFDSDLKIPLLGWRKALNSILPADISIMSVEEVAPDFHARFDAKGKEYRYRIQTGDVPDPLRRHYVYHYPYPLNEEAMTRAIDYLIGTHDFTSFCSAKTEMEDKVRTIYHISFVRNDDELIFRFVGNGFLYNMVRIVMGTLLEVGSGLRQPEDIKAILLAKDRRAAGKTAPAQGLYLWQVFYDEKSLMTTNPGVTYS